MRCNMRFREILSFNVLVAAMLLPATAFSQTSTNFQVGALTRKALVYVPSGINHPPLLISLHGMGIGAGWNQAQMMKFEPIADRDKFVVVYPEADQNLQWDLGGTHDIDFMLTIIDEMSKSYNIDLNRVYVSGFSMGGMFSYTLACKLPDKIAAIAPGDGYPLGGEFGCVQTRSVPIFHMHGTADDFVAYSGIHAFLNTKITAYGCPTTAVRTEPYPPSKPDSKSFKEYWGPCTNANGQTSEIILISVTGMIHDWATAGKANANEDPVFAGKPFDIDGSEEAWAFLKTHSLDESPPVTGGTGGTGGTSDVGTIIDAGTTNDGGTISIDTGTGGTMSTGDTTSTGGTMSTGGDTSPVGGSGYVTAGAGGELSSGSGGAIAGSGVPAKQSDAGCSCRAVRSSGSSGSWSGLLLGLSLLLTRMVRRRYVIASTSTGADATSETTRRARATR
jgi:poly(3-hydroxybutyrate) depolymerase